ncbi:MAG: hypothetical protein GX495_16965 [Chloroflexi bacterium]|jgi:two-component system nitrate/nitrite sensor histidine kinase NarX|nr:hypothetical protein [Chloroflexota bacterium]
MIETTGSLIEGMTFQYNNLDSLFSITGPGTNTPTTISILQQAIKPVQEITGFNAVAARVHDPRGSCFKLIAHGGLQPGVIQILSPQPAEGTIYEEKMPVVVAAEAALQVWGYREIIYIPLLAGEVTVGFVELLSTHENHLSEGEFNFYALIGKILGSMIFQAQRAECLQRAAMIQERVRLAQELHDDVAQLVRSMRWGLDEARVTLDNQQLDKTYDILDNLETLAQHTADYLREEMLCLREGVECQEGIIPILEGMLQRFERNWGIKTALIVVNDAADHFRGVLSPAAETQLVRIVQEALMNVRRHAEASSVLVRITGDENRLIITIVDDGVGFCEENIPHDRLGIRIARERAASIGAKVNIDSHRGAGTIFKVEIPCCTEVPA